jgi:hypothetical protein
VSALALALVLQTLDLRAGLAKDAEVLEKAFISLHPGLYRYQLPAKIRFEFGRLRSDWGHCEDLRQAYVALSEFTAKIQCGHTYPNFFNQRKEVVQAVFAGNNRLPFYFRWLNGRMIVLKDFTPERVLSPGTEIERIDGIPCGDALKRLMKIARADGGNDFKRTAYLSVTGDDTFEAFDIYFPLMFSVPEGRFKLVVRDVAGKERKVGANAVSMEDRVREYQEAAAAPNGALWKLQYSGKAAILTMPTWELYNTNWDWQSFLKASFEQIALKQVGNLIFDLRGNEGGNSIANDVLAYLVRGQIPPSQYHLYSRYASVEDSLKPYVSSWTSEDFSGIVGKRGYVTAGRNFFYDLDRLRDDPLGSTPVENSARFDGRVFVLVDGANSSATFEFEQLIQELKRGLLVGEPTGGNLRGINGGRFFFLRLPNSRLEVDIPLVAEFPSTPQPDRGLRPDVTVAPTTEDIAAGRDAVLERVRQLIEQSETRSAYSPLRRETSG